MYSVNPIKPVEEIKKMEETFQNNNKKMIKDKEEKEILLRDSNVARYKELNEEMLELEILQKRLKDDLKLQHMLHCEHKFVITRVDRFFDGHRTDRTEIVKCIHCGLTNNGFDNIYFEDSQMKTAWRYSNKGLRVIGNYVDNDIPYVKQAYDELKNNNLDMTDSEIEKHLSDRVKKLKNNK